MSILGYEKHVKSSTSNSRNGYSKKILRTEDGQFELSTPRGIFTLPPLCQ
ncbi:hypothetical protein ELY14_10330 [Legionella septentrionalis]|nr:hypothetical protein ELY14_10330 [Legionella septentrionalis]